MSNLSEVLSTLDLVTTSPVGWVLFDTDLVVRDCNDAALALFAVTRDEILGRSPRELHWTAERLDGEATDQPAARTLATAQPTFATVLGLSVGARRFRWLSINTYPVVDAQRVSGVVSSYADVSDAVRTHRNLDVSLAVSQISRSVERDVDYLDQLCLALVHRGHFPLAFLTRNVARDTVIAHAAGLVRELRQVVTASPAAAMSGRGLTGLAVRGGEPQIANHALDDPRLTVWREPMAALGLRSMIAIPFATAGAALVLHVLSHHEDEFDETTVRGLEAVVHEIDLGIRHVTASERLREAFDGTLAALAEISEARDPYNAGHQRGVGTLGEAIARQLGLDRAMSTLVRQAGEVHDIGKVVVPAEILTRPGALSELEFSLIRGHCETGSQILRHARLPWPIAEVALQHHERLDGSGYPQGLRDGDIIAPARIIAVADTVEAMTHHRPYRPARTLDDALAEITGGAGVRYDADVVAACRAVFDDGFTFARETASTPRRDGDDGRE